VHLLAHLRTTALAAIVVILASAALGMLTSWQAPGLDRYSRDWLVRVRGPVAVSPEIAIVAIDDASIAKFGRFPWPRATIARAVNAIAAGQPKAIALDILFSEPTDAVDDDALAEALQRAGNVVLGAQLIDRGVYGSQAEWLEPLPLLAARAAGTGHVNAGAESDGVARQTLVEQSDDNGRLIRALPIETFRVGNRIPEGELVYDWDKITIGSRSIPAIPADNPLSGAAQLHRSATMKIDYAGPPGTFAGQQYSIADILEGKVPAGTFRDRYVLVGSTAASLGERFASPFAHYADARGNQHGASMSGVEVFANALNTIVKGRFHTEMPDFWAFCFAAMAAWLGVSVLAAARGWHAFAMLLAAGGAIAGISYLFMNHLWIYPPMTAALIAFGAGSMSSMLLRSMRASAGLDEGIGEVRNSLNGLGASVNPVPEKLPRRLLPEGLEEKTRTILQLNELARRQAEFFQASMRAVEDGLLIATPDGKILFGNSRAAAILDVSPNTLCGRNLFELVPFGGKERSDFLERMTVNQRSVERELSLGPNRYTVRLAPVLRGEPGSRTDAIVASLSDITRQHELGRVRTDVVTLVSHEMRTPLTAIQGMTELMAAYEIEPVRRKEMALAINDEVKRLARMIDEYLDIARLEMRKTAPRKVPLHLELVIERCLLLFEPLAQEKSIRLVRKFDRALMAILADGDLLSRVFSNLISNAIKYSPPGTEIQVSTECASDRICVKVQDQGYGIPPNDIERIFEKFYRIPRLQDADVPGTGLGLSFVREIVELHGGTVAAQSSPGFGSVFTVFLPAGESNQVR